MNENINCFIITHGDLAIELKNVADKFLPFSIPVFTYSNEKDSIDKIMSEVSEKIEQNRPENILVFIDFFGGSCLHAAMGLKKNMKMFQ